MAKTPFSSSASGAKFGTPDLQFSIDFSNATWDGVGTHQLLSVTGFVRILFTARVTTSVSYPGSIGNIQLGLTSDTDYLIGAKAGNTLAQYYIWGIHSGAFKKHVITNNYNLRPVRSYNVC